MKFVNKMHWKVATDDKNQIKIFADRRENQPQDDLLILCCRKEKKRDECAYAEGLFFLCWGFLFFFFNWFLCH
jgi:hypothetical protein